MYAIVRADLPRPQITVQACHAILAATNTFIGGTPITHPHLIVCQVANEAELTDAFERLKVAGVAVCAYREDDLDDSLTASVPPGRYEWPSSPAGSDGT